MDKKGNVGIIVLWTIIIIGIFVINFVYGMLTKPIAVLDDKVRPELTADQLETWNKIEDDHNNTPRWVYFGMVGAGVVGSIALTRRNQYESY